MRPLLPVEEPRDLGHLVPLQAAQLALDLPHQLEYIPSIFSDQELPTARFAKDSNIRKNIYFFTQPGNILAFYLGFPDEAFVPKNAAL